MAVYNDHVLPRLVNVVCNTKVAREQRTRVCAGLSGEVVELGFGSGLNVPFYPAEVTGVDAIDPAGVGWKLAADRVREAGVPVRRSGLDGASLPFPDDRFDAALSTWTMCTIPDIDGALRELRRVLKPGGRLHFVEHGLAPDESVRAWQHRLNPVQNRLFGGCNLNRPTIDLLRGAGFEIAEVDEYYEQGSPKFIGANALGVAASP
jgi:ubiquinone/menaquinone biosynthesis C-methylase UbiE